jgi:hypothetical protein
MIILDETDTSIKVVLDSIPLTSELDCVASWSEFTATSFDAQGNDFVTTGFTPVTAVAAPAANTKRQLKYMSIINRDTAYAGVTINYDNGGTIRQIHRAIIAPGEKIVYVDGQGWSEKEPWGYVEDISEPTDYTLIRAPQILTSGTSYAKPAGCRAIIVEVVGGGGNGGTANAGSPSPGGGAGGYARKFYNVASLPGPFTYAVGGVNGQSTFSDGTTTISGSPGGNGTAGAPPQQGGTGGAASNGDVNVPGQAGQGSDGTTPFQMGGRGGDGPWGGARGARVGSQGDGVQSTGFGSGGQGATPRTYPSETPQPGSGIQGVVIIWEFK